MGGTTSLVFNFLRGRDNVSSHMGTIATRAQAMAAKLKSMSSMTSVWIGALIAIIAGLIAEIVAFIDATAPMAGALAALPAIAFAAVAGLAALIVGFHGLGAAMKKYSSGAGQSAEAAAAAEHRLEMAQRSALQAQIDLNDARKTAAERLAGVTRELARAHLDERAAILAVKDAQMELRQAAGSGDRSAVEHAKLGYDEAVQSLAEVRARLADVAEEERKRSAAGVEGSDEVQAALQRQTDAVYELAQAQRALTSGGGGADKAAEAYAKLTAQGKALVDVLHAISPAWRQVQQATQAVMLDKLSLDISRLSTLYLPVMRTQLPAIAQGWNNMFRSIAGVSSESGFVADMNSSLGLTATMWQRVGSSFGAFWSGFRHWVVIGSSFLPRLGSWTQKQAATFDHWSKAMRDSGKGAAWIEKALKSGHDFWVLLKNLTMATIALFSAGSAGDGYLKNLSDGAAAMRDFLNTDEGKAQAANLFTQLRDIWSAAWKAFKQLLDALSQANLSGVIGVFTVAGAAFAFLAQHMDVVNKLLPILIPAFVGLKFGILAVTAAQTLWDAAMDANPIGLVVLAVAAFIATIVLLIKYHKEIWQYVLMTWMPIWNLLKAIGAWFAGPFVDFFVNAWHAVEAAFKWDNIIAGFKAGVNWMIRAWNAIDFGIHIHVPSWVPEFGGRGFDIDDVVPDIPYLDTGGTIMRTGAAVVHRGETIVPAAPAAASTSGRGRNVVVLTAGDDFGRFMLQMLRKAVRDRGGDVQFVLGR